MGRENAHPAKKNLAKPLLLVAAGIALIVCGIIVCVFFFGTGTREPGGETPADTLLAEVKRSGALSRKIGRDEYAFFESLVRRDAYNVSDPEIAEKTRAMIVEVNAKFAAGNCLGVCGTYSYPKMKNDLEKENASRKKKKETGEVFYGPVSFDETGYFNYKYSSLDLDIVNAYMNNASQFGEDVLRAFYEENIERYETIAEVVYELSINGHSEVRSADWSELKSLQWTDHELGAFLLENVENAVLEYETVDDRRKATILSVSKTRQSFEDALHSVTLDYVHLRYYADIVEQITRMSKLTFP